MGSVVKGVVGIAAPIVGGILGGPVGAAIGGAIGGAVSGGGLKGALMGGVGGFVGGGGLTKGFTTSGGMLSGGFGGGAAAGGPGGINAANAVPGLRSAASAAPGMAGQGAAGGLTTAAASGGGLATQASTSGVDMITGQGQFGEQSDILSQINAQERMKQGGFDPDFGGMSEGVQEAARGGGQGSGVTAAASTAGGQGATTGGGFLSGINMGQVAQGGMDILSGAQQLYAERNQQKYYEALQEQQEQYAQMQGRHREKYMDDIEARLQRLSEDPMSVIDTEAYRGQQRELRRQVERTLIAQGHNPAESGFGMDTLNKALEEHTQSFIQNERDYALALRNQSYDAFRPQTNQAIQAGQANTQSQYRQQTGLAGIARGAGTVAKGVFGSGGQSSAQGYNPATGGRQPAFANPTSI